MIFVLFQFKFQFKFQSEKCQSSFSRNQMNVLIWASSPDRKHTENIQKTHRKHTEIIDFSFIIEIIIILSCIMFVWIDRLHNICSETPICKARWLYLQFCHTLHSVLWPLVSHLRFSMTSNTMNFTVITRKQLQHSANFIPPTPPCLARFSHDALTPPPLSRVTAWRKSSGCQWYQN